MDRASDEWCKFDIWVAGRGWLVCPSSYVSGEGSRTYGVAYPFYRRARGLTVLWRRRT
jgi:hypothetical protein